MSVFTKRSDFIPQIDVGVTIFTLRLLYPDLAMLCTHWIEEREQAPESVWLTKRKINLSSIFNCNLETDM
jgi:hypothetical protein